VARGAPPAWIPLLALLGACASPPPPPAAGPDPGSHGLELLVVSPHGEAEIRNSAALVEVSGRVGQDWLMRADVVIGIDLSNSALLASGVDVDGDGRLGRTHHFAEDGGGLGRVPSSWTSDPDDTIARAELETARHLIRGLGSPDLRIGIFTYTEEPKTRALLGAPARALASLDEIAFVEDWTGTNVARALRHAGDLFLAVPRLEGTERPRVVFLLSDGRPTVPQARYWAAREAIEAARELSERHIAVCVLGFGEGIVSEDDPEPDDIAFLEELARVTGCQSFPVMEPRMFRFDRAPRDEPPAELALRNLTSGAAGRAVRLLEGGLFDGFLDLVPGENEIEVSVRLADGRELRTRRVVRYAPAEVEGEEERRETARLLLRLRERAGQLPPAVSAGPADEPPPVP